MKYLALIVIIIAAIGTPVPAQALPVFAHRWGLQCQACHTTVPHLNRFGQAFARNGFRLPTPRRAAIPVAVKVNLAYASDPDPGGLPKTIVDEVEFLTAGAIGTRMNYFLEQYVVDGGRPGFPRDAWIQYNGGAVHVRAGQFTLQLPVDPETERDTEAHYLIYDQTVGANSFDFFDPRIGIDAYTGDEGNGFHLAALWSRDRQSGNPPAGLDLSAYAAKSLRGFTVYAYRYQGQRRIGASDAFFRQGFGARQRFGKMQLTEIAQQGHDAGLNAASSGGFAQMRYAFSDALTAVARYGRVWDSIGGSQHQTVLTLVTRPARNMRFTVEDQITNRQSLNVGWLFAY